MSTGGNTFDWGDGEGSASGYPAPNKVLKGEVYGPNGEYVGTMEAVTNRFSDSTLTGPNLSAILEEK